MFTYEKAKNFVAGLIARRMYTCGEIETKLKQKKTDKEVIEQIISEFAELKLLDDKLYARMYVSEAVRLGAKGFFRIKQELYAKGIARSIIDEACDECEEDTYAALCEYVETHKLCEGVSSRNDLEKLKAKLARRGFSSSEIRECLLEYKFHFEDEF